MAKIMEALPERRRSRRRCPSRERLLLGSLDGAPAALATVPNSTAAIATPAALPTAPGSASGRQPGRPGSSHTRGALVLRSGHVPAPTSRRPASRAARAARPRWAAIGIKASGRGPVSGWSSSTQPSGVAQIEPVQARCRRRPPSAGRNSRPRKAAAYAAAWRRRASWLVSAPTARNRRRWPPRPGRSRGSRPRRSATLENDRRPQSRSAVIAQMTPAPAPRPASAWPAARLARGLPAQQQLPAPGVLLAAQQPGARISPQIGPDDDQEHGHLESGEASDGLQLRRRAEQRARAWFAPNAAARRCRCGSSLVDPA